MASARTAPLLLIALCFALVAVFARSAIAQGDSDFDGLIKQLSELNQAGRYSEGITLAQRAANLAQTKFGRNHIKYSDALTYLAYFHEQLGHHAEADPLARRTLSIAENTFGANHPNLAGPLNNLANICWHRGRYAEAEALHKRGLAIKEKTLGANHLSVAGSLGNLGLVYEDQGRYAEAEVVYKRALAITESALGPNHPRVAGALHNLANTYYNLNRYSEAEALEKRSLAIKEAAANGLSGDVTVGIVGNDVAASLYNLARLYRAQDRYAEAEPLYRRSLELWEKTYGPNHPYVAGALSGLARAHERQGRYAEAEELYRRALAIEEAALGPNHSHVAISLDTLGGVYEKQGRYADAEAYYKRSLEIREAAFGANHPDIIDSLISLGSLEVRQRHWSQAHGYFQRAAALQSARDLAGAQEDQRSSEIRENGNVFWSLADSAYVVAQAEPARHDELMAEAFVAVQSQERQVAGAALAQMAGRFSSGSAALAQRVREYQDAVLNWRDLDKKLTTSIAAPPAQRNETEIATLRSTLEAGDQRLVDLRRRLAEDYPQIAELTNPAPLTITQVQHLLARDEALVVMLLGTQGGLVWAVTREDADWRGFYIPWETLRANISALRQGLDVETDQLRAGKATLFNLRVAHELYATLLGPVAKTLAGKHHLIIVPPGPLSSLPFQLLVREPPAIGEPSPDQLSAYRDAAWLTRTHALSVLPSVASLRALRTLGGKLQAEKPFVGYGDPDFSRGAPGARQTKMAARTRSYSSYWSGSRANLDVLAQGLSPLPETADELRAVAKMLGAKPSDIHLGRAATEAAIKRADLSSYRIVYFATHGLVAGELQGLGEPALALTLPVEPTDLDDGLLTASEVGQLRLNADWVVLSACNTAAGDKPGAEALSGLARAFFYAGARALLVSHWRVDSAAAVRLTTSTFEALKKDASIGRAEALRRAMLTMMEDTSSPWNAYPDSWGAFSVVGEGGRPEANR
jgi:CHAT domain-containing protein/Tfp pilus assembly protein PilF